MSKELPIWELKNRVAPRKDYISYVVVRVTYLTITFF